MNEEFTDPFKAPPLPPRSKLRKTFFACVAMAVFFVYIYFGNFQMLLKSRYSDVVGIQSLWVSSEGHYYMHMIAINGLILLMIVLLWVIGKITGKRLIVLLLIVNLLSLGAGYANLNGSSFTATNDLMLETVEEMARTLRSLPAKRLDHYPRSRHELSWVYKKPISPYSYEGQELPINIVVIDKASGPFTEWGKRTDLAGTIYYAVDQKGEHFWITFLEYDFARKHSVLGTGKTEGMSGDIIILTEIAP